MYIIRNERITVEIVSDRKIQCLFHFPPVRQIHRQTKVISVRYQLYSYG